MHQNLTIQYIKMLRVTVTPNGDFREQRLVLLVEVSQPLNRPWIVSFPCMMPSASKSAGELFSAILHLQQDYSATAHMPSPGSNVDNQYVALGDVN